MHSLHIHRVYKRFDDTNEIKQVKRQITFSHYFINERWTSIGTRRLHFQRLRRCVCAGRSINYPYNNAQVVRRLIRFSLTLLWRAIGITRAMCRTKLFQANQKRTARAIVVCRKIVHWTFHTLWRSTERSRSRIRLHEKTWFNKMKLVHINRKVNCIFERRTHWVCIGKFCIVRTNTAENQCGRCLQRAVVRKMLCDADNLYSVFFPWLRFFAQCHLV